MKNKLIIAALVLLGGIGLAFSPKAKETFDIPFLSKKNQEITADRQIALPQLTTQDLAVDTIPQKKGKSSATIIDNGRKIKIEKENGEITKMEVDGELIDPSEYDRYVDEFNGFDFNFDDDALGNFHFKGLPHGNMFFFKDKNQWPGFDEDEFAKMFEQLDSLHGFKFNFGPEFGQNFNFNFDLDSMMGPDFNLSEMMEKMQEGLKGIPFNHDFDFGNGFDFDQDFDFGPDFEFEDFDGFRHSGKISDRLGRSLNKDGLLKEGVENEVELTGKHLKINGEKQPSNIHEKYKDLFEEYSGIEVNEDSKIVLKIEGKKERSRGLRRI